jgi:hypothetical protein
MKMSMRKVLATAAITVVGAVPFVAGSLAGAQQPVASASCTNAPTPGGTKCLGPGEFCSHKAGYAAAYKKAGYRCNRKGRLEYR